MNEQILENKEVRERLDTMMAMALIRGIYEKNMISKDVMECVERKYKKRLIQSNKRAIIDTRTNVGMRERN